MTETKNIEATQNTVCSKTERFSTINEFEMSLGILILTLFHFNSTFEGAQRKEKWDSERVGSHRLNYANHHYMMFNINTALV